MFCLASIVYPLLKENAPGDPPQTQIVTFLMGHEAYTAFRDFDGSLFKFLHSPSPNGEAWETRLQECQGITDLIETLMGLGSPPIDFEYCEAAPPGSAVLHVVGDAVDVEREIKRLKF